MKSEHLAEELRARIKSPILTEEPMSRHTSWRVGGPAQLLVDVHSIEDLRLARQYAQEKGLATLVIGAGTNLLIRQGGLRGLVLKIGEGLGHLSVHGVQITSGAGVRLSHLARAACAHCLEGFSFMAGIPGSVGGALVMNAGAYGSSVSKVVEKVVLLNAAGEQEEREALALDFGYRRSNLLHSEYIVVEAVFRGVPGNAAKIQGEMDKGLAARRAAQPLEYPNAGSVFKNPPGDFAGRLIELAGCKGLRLGGAQVSEKHANFIVNVGNATADDVLGLLETVQEAVYRCSGIQLVSEIQVAGDH